MNPENERMFFLRGIRGDIFVHQHGIDVTPAGVFVFLSPFLDEKKRAQHFMAQVARGICSAGHVVFRFDYYGTGDSKGAPYELSGDDMLHDLDRLVQYIRSVYPHTQVHVAGIRLGADIALKWAAAVNDVRHLLLIEPVFNGNKYLTEQRTRRRIFHKIHNMTAAENVVIENVVYEDFQGYPLSASVLQFIGSLNTASLPLQEKTIFLYKLDNPFSAKYHTSFTEQLSSANHIQQINVPVPAFWNKLEIIDTTLLVEKIMTTVNDIYSYVR